MMVKVKEKSEVELVLLKMHSQRDKWVGAQNLKKPADSRHRRQNLRKSLQPTAIM